MMSKMENDKDDKHRIRRWYIGKGIDQEEAAEEKDAKKDEEKDRW